MGIFKCTKGEKEILKVAKMNQDMSKEITESMAGTRSDADSAIAESEALLRSLGMGKKVDAAKQESKKAADSTSFTFKPEIASWENLVNEANSKYPEELALEDLLSPAEIASAFQEADEINEEFSRKTGIINKTDLIFLAIATALQTAKALIYPYIAQQFGYGKKVDPSSRHDHKYFDKQHRKDADKFREKHQKNNSNGKWINFLYQSVPYDAIKGSKDVLGNGLNGNDHRLKTLGHDPVLGWIFGTANILTDTITFNTFQTCRVARNPLHITPVSVDPVSFLTETIQMIKADRMNLPAAIFSEAIHMKSDVFTKRGLPVPVLSTFNESFATELYNSQYDALCFSRDLGFVAGSAGISILFDIIIGLVHHIFFDPNKDDKKLYEVRTRKILLISNIIASSSSVIAACITSNPKQLDIGGLLTTVAHLFFDLRFIAKIKKEFVETEIQKRLQVEIDNLDELYNAMLK